MSGSSGFLDELRKRGVVRAALLYAAGAFAVLEFADIAFPRLGIPDGAVNVVLWVGLAGFPLALLASWVVEVRAERDSGQIRSWFSPSTLVTSAVLVALGIGMGLVWGGAESDPPSIARPAAAPAAGPGPLAGSPVDRIGTSRTYRKRRLYSLSARWLRLVVPA